MNFNDSSVLITGASQGIGRSIAIEFSKKTQRPILLLARNKTNLFITKDLCEQAGAKQVEVFVCDASDETQTQSIKLPSGLPEPAVIVNNAGSYLFKKVSDTTNEEFMQQIDANLFTAVNTVNRFIPSLYTYERSLIINICSVGALQGLPESGAYSAAKHALLGYTRSLRMELESTNIGVTAINLGQTHSPSWDESDMSPDRLINPSDVASLIVSITKFSPRSIVEEITIQPQHGRVSPM